MRSYVVKRLLHFRHSRRRRIDSASLLSRESTTLSLANPQKGHFMRLWLRTKRPLRPNLVFWGEPEIVSGDERVEPQCVAAGSTSDRKLSRAEAIDFFRVMTFRRELTQ